MGSQAGGNGVGEGDGAVGGWLEETAAKVEDTTGKRQRDARKSVVEGTAFPFLIQHLHEIEKIQSSFGLTGRHRVGGFGKALPCPLYG